MMKLIISVILILTSCFANATGLNYHSERTRLYQLTKKFEEQKTLPRLYTKEGKEILSQFTEPKLLENFSKDKIDEKLDITNYINH